MERFAQRGIGGDQRLHVIGLASIDGQPIGERPRIRTAPAEKLEFLCHTGAVVQTREHCGLIESVLGHFAVSGPLATDDRDQAGF